MKVLIFLVMMMGFSSQYLWAEIQIGEVPNLVELAFSPAYRPARHGHSLASQGIQAVLALEIVHGQRRPTQY